MTAQICSHLKRDKLIWHLRCEWVRILNMPFWCVLTAYRVSVRTWATKQMSSEKTQQTNIQLSDNQERKCAGAWGKESYFICESDSQYSNQTRRK